MSFTWDRPPRQAWNVERYENAVQAAVVRQMEFWAGKIEADMKQNATWTDRTSNARQSLASFVFTLPSGEPVLVAKQQMDYGVWLEIANGGKYAIVMPTLQLYYQQVIESLRELLR